MGTHGEGTGWWWGRKTEVEWRLGQKEADKTGEMRWEVAPREKNTEWQCRDGGEI
jgi:hypothetical protein